MNALDMNAEGEKEREESMELLLVEQNNGEVSPPQKDAYLRDHAKCKEHGKLKTRHLRLALAPARSAPQTAVELWDGATRSYRKKRP